MHRHQHGSPPPRLTGRTVATHRRGNRIIAVVTTEQYAVATEADGATDEQLDAVIERLNGLLATVRKSTRTGP